MSAADLVSSFLISSASADAFSALVGGFFTGSGFGGALAAASSSALF